MNNDIVVPLEVETTTVSNNTKISVNRIKSVYGFDNTRWYNLNDYINKKLEDNKFIKIYEKKEQGTGFSTVASSFSNTNISELNIIVNYIVVSVKWFLKCYTMISLK